MPIYEYHHHNDSSFKIIFGKYRISDDFIFQTHWHKSPELLLPVEGTISVSCNGIKQTGVPSELIVVGSNQLHEISALTKEATYYCLIVDSSVCENIENLPPKTRNEEIVELYRKIVSEFEKKDKYYHEIVIGYAKVLFSLLSRENADRTEKLESQNIRKVETVKKTIQYIYENFQKEINLEAISCEINISKFYLSHIFKEITGKTIIEHLNYIRCTHARTLLKSGKYTVTEACYAAGFTNRSYFTKTYKKIVGNLPLRDLER